MKAAFFLLACAVATAGVSAGCARTQAKATLEPPPLNVPMPPPRVVETVLVEDAAPEPPAQEPVADVTPPRQTSTPTSRTARPPEPKPEPTEAAIKPEEAPRAATPAAPLQTLPPSQEKREEDNIRALLTVANGNLGRVDYRALGVNGRTQYDQAKGFIRQADDALKARNLVFARSLADKAATLAAQLAGR